MKAHLYELKCLTNLHAGSGDENYKVIDNEVERDPVTGMPTIFSSGVKGAIREFLEQEAKMLKDKGENQKAEKLNEQIAIALGAVIEEEENDNGEKTGENEKAEKLNEQIGAVIEREENGNGEKTRKKKISVPGQYKFLSATLIGRPLRISDGEGAYILTGAADFISDYMDMLKDLDISIDGMDEEIPFPEEGMVSSVSDIKIEGMETEQKSSSLMTALLGEKWALASSKTLEQCALPVQARNVLKENGTSDNLWYEEVVPHKSIFHMIIITPKEENLLDSYINGKIIQFGADASIGYGLCKVKKLN